MHVYIGPYNLIKFVGNALIRLTVQLGLHDWAMLKIGPMHSELH